MTYRVAVIDDDRTFLDFMEETLKVLGYQAEMFWRDDDTTYAEVRRYDPHIIMLDIRMSRPDSGWRLLERLQQDPAFLRTKSLIICSGDLQQLQDRAAELEAHGYDVLCRPFGISDLRHTLERASARLP